MPPARWRTSPGRISRGCRNLPNTLDPSIVSVYIANAAIGVLDAWVLGEIDATPDQIVAHLMALMPRWVSTPGIPTSTNHNFGTSAEGSVALRAPVSNRAIIPASRGSTGWAVSTHG